MFAQPVADILPSELIYEILLHAAKSSTSSCRTLCQVSTWTRCLALPHLYTTVFTTPQTLPMLYLSLGSPPVLPPDSSFDQVTAVQNLWLAFRSERPTHNLLKIRIVQRCRNLSHLAIDARDLAGPACSHAAQQCGAYLLL
ncbi:hypothetical protein BD779DRAFT_1677914 [Infundibulicybe gibba]|nr:hypothetical protein BD779DRAFT_1677914 [Infundibulicybe gibba]